MFIGSKETVRMSYSKLKYCEKQEQVISGQFSEADIQSLLYGSFVGGEDSLKDFTKGMYSLKGDSYTFFIKL